MSKTYAANEKLKYARELRGWSQEELARQIAHLAEQMGYQGVVLDVSTISRWERGRNTPSHFYRQLLCSLFDMNAEELGLLAPGEQFQAAPVPPSSPPLIDFDRQAIPLAETGSREVPESIREDDLKQQHGAEKLASPPTPPTHSVRRRTLLLTLLAGATLGSTALVATLIQNTPSPTPSGSQLTRHWPQVTPDIHKKLVRVRVIQWMLNAHGANVQIDGVFGEQTENALILFEAHQHLPVTDRVSSDIWEHIIIPSQTRGLQDMDEGSQVKALQETLNIYGASPQLQVDGDFGPLTEAATRHFQQTHRLPVNGKADLNTWCVLVGGYVR